MIHCQGWEFEGLGDIVVDPEKTADCEYVNLWSANVLMSYHVILSSLILSIDAANVTLAMGREILSANFTVSTNSFALCFYMVSIQSISYKTNHELSKG